MQKLSKTIFYITVLITIFGLFYLNNYPIIKTSNVIEVYKNHPSSSCSILNLNYINTCLTFNRYGEGYTLTSSQTSAKQILEEYDAKIVKVEKIEEGTSYYGYSKQIKYCKYLFGKKVNIHVFEKDSVIKIGFPIIYGSY